MATIICPHCGTANRVGANFCNTCGTDMRMDEASPPASVEPVIEPTPDQETEATATHAEATSTESATAREPDPDAAPVDDELTLPLFDLGLASPGDEEEAWLADQPWLQDKSDDIDATADVDDVDDVVENVTAPIESRLITGVQGLLAPLNISLTADDAEPLSTSPAVEPAHAVALSLEQVRRFRRLMGEEPTPATAVNNAQPRGPSSRGWPSLRIPWLFWLIGLAVAIPVILSLRAPTGEARLWPGVRATYVTIEGLSSNAPVLVYWAYDPATSGELDMVAEPVIQHLLARRAQLIVASTLPGGPASARRLVARAVLDDSTRDDELERPAQTVWDNVTLATADSLLAANVFLPGGVAALPLLAQDLPAVVYGHGAEANAGQSTPPSADGPEPAAQALTPELTVVFAAEAEDVQHWLEQVQPLNGAPVIAVTSAGVDPMVRPYLDSGQLQGLVSGFDGAYRYAEFRADSRTLVEAQRARQRLVAQNWGQIALLIIIGLGNLAVVLGRRREA